jgi:alpha-N-arabinofuranosidase
MKRIIAAFLVPLLGLPAADVTIRVNPAISSPHTIDSQLFGSFYEEHWGDVTPGIFEQYLVNPSFEPWYVSPDENKTRLVFETPEYDGVAFPWEPLPGNEGALARSSDKYNSEYGQRITVAGNSGGIVQRLALPDYRTQGYKLRLALRSEGDVRIAAGFLEGSAGLRILDRQDLDPSADWTVREVTLTLGGRLPEKWLTRFGVARLAIFVEGTGSAWVDQATLYPDDAVDGLYNPETLTNIRKFRPTAIRWPGGNYTSGYHWRDGIGPIDRRPTRPNRSWGGVDPNHVGTDEWLRFAELAGLTPVMGVGFGEVTPEEAAEWVEYCNGDASTPMGSLRAANGRAEPYGVRFWGVGNEVYGSYQIGNTDATTYANGLVAAAAAMKSKDSSIRIAGVALGVHNDYRGQSRSWNRTVVGIAGPHIDLLDSHYYVYGPVNPLPAEYSASEVHRALAASGGRLTRYVEGLRALIGERPETAHLKLVHYEWGVLPRASELRSGRQTFVNLLYTADQYHAFFRNADLVRGAMLHNFSYYLNPIGGHSEPPNPRSHLSAHYASFANGRLVECLVDSPQYLIPRNIPEIGPLDPAGEVDAIAVLTENGDLHVSMLNRSRDQTFSVEVRFAGVGSSNAEVTRMTGLRPSDGFNWSTQRTTFSIDTSSGEIRDGVLAVELRPYALISARVPAPSPTPEESEPFERGSRRPAKTAP